MNTFAALCGKLSAEHRTGAAMGKLNFAFFETTEKKEHAIRFPEAKSKGYPKAKTKPNSHANTPLKCLVLKSLNKRCPVPLRGSANPEPLRLGRWQSLEQKSSPSYRVHGQKKNPALRGLCQNTSLLHLHCRDSVRKSTHTQSYKHTNKLKK